MTIREVDAYIVERMIEYLKTRDKELLLPEEYDIDANNLTVIVTNVISWLKLERKREIWKSQGRKADNKSLELNDKYPWCVALRDLVEWGLFKDYFCVRESKFDFLETISQEEKSAIRTYAYDNYNPQKHTYDR